jgi:hypothetical protein
VFHDLKNVKIAEKSLKIVQLLPILANFSHIFEWNSYGFFVPQIWVNKSLSMMCSSKIALARLVSIVGSKTINTRLPLSNPIRWQFENENVFFLTIFREFVRVFQLSTSFHYSTANQMLYVRKNKSCRSKNVLRSYFTFFYLEVLFLQT